MVFKIKAMGLLWIFTGKHELLLTLLKAILNCTELYNTKQFSIHLTNAFLSFKALLWNTSDFKQVETIRGAIRNQIVLDLVKLEFDMLFKYMYLIFLKTMPWNHQRTETINMHYRSNVCGNFFNIYEISLLCSLH